MSMNWGAWLQGLISAISNGILTAIGASVVIPGQTTLKQLAMIAIIPTAISFFMYIKQSPPPIGGIEVKP